MFAKESIGKKFGRLTVMEICKYKTNNRQTMVKCLCDCGNVVITRWASLVSKHTNSCGCYKREQIIKASVGNHFNTKPRHFKKGNTYGANKNCSNTGYTGISYVNGKYYCHVQRAGKRYATTKKDLFDAVEWVNEKREELYGIQ